MISDTPSESAVRKTTQEVIQGDCLEVMRGFADKSFDLVLTDPPYGTTSNEWDTVVDFFDEAMRITRTGVIVFASQPFTSDLISKNRKYFKYGWIWNKGMTGNFAIAKYQPLKVHEDVLVFGDAEYRPIMRKGKLRMKGGSDKGNANTGGLVSVAHESDDYYPESILNFGNAGLRIQSMHPTQKPVELLKYLIQTYSKESDTILDPFAGSCTTAVACKQLNRNCTAIEISPEYCEIGRRRLEQQTLL